jgi:quercetin dioxygenase-like cupin family protein
MKELQAKRFDTPDEVRRFADDRGRIDLVELDGNAVGRGTFEPGWRWSEHVKQLSGTDSCEVDHIGFVVKGQMTVAMDDGAQLTVGPGDVFHMPPGHDAWIVGDEPCVVIDWQGVADYAKG